MSHTLLGSIVALVVLWMIALAPLFFLDRPRLLDGGVESRAQHGAVLSRSVMPLRLELEPDERE